MGQTVKHVPRTYNYAEARARHDQITPIRNRVPELRPLGQRRDHQYWVRMDGDDVQYMLYRTPVVSFLSDGVIEIRNDGYNSVTTHAFIVQVLGYANVQASGYLNKTKLEVDGEVLVIGDGGVARLAWGEDGKLRFAQEVPDQYQYVMNRKAANNVRRRYKEFADYLEGFISLRATTETQPLNLLRQGRVHQTQVERENIVIPVAELVEALGATRVPAGHDLIASNLTYWGMVASNGKHQYTTVVRDRPKQERQLLASITSDQPEETKHLNFYKAALALATVGRNFVATDKQELSMNVNPQALRDFFKEGLMVAHAKEVLTLTKLPRGRVPHKKYTGWVIEGETK